MTTIAFPWSSRIEERSTPSLTAVEPDAEYGHVTSDPRIWGGAAVIAGTRIPVYMIEDLYEDGETVPEMLERYPHLTLGDIFGALSYAERYSGIVEADRRRHRVFEGDR